jgi:putative ABC transport system substrate-binding protein
MKRREFITLLGGAAVTWPLAASYSAVAQSGRKVWRIGYLSGMYGSTELSQSFIQGLSELGYVDGQNLIVQFRFALGKNERLAELATDLVHEGVDHYGGNPPQR